MNMLQPSFIPHVSVGAKSTSLSSSVQTPHLATGFTHNSQSSLAHTQAQTQAAFVHAALMGQRYAQYAWEAAAAQAYIQNHGHHGLYQLAQNHPLVKDAALCKAKYYSDPTSSHHLHSDVTATQSVGKLGDGDRQQSNGCSIAPSSASQATPSSSVSFPHAHSSSAMQTLPNIHEPVPKTAHTSTISYSYQPVVMNAAMTRGLPVTQSEICEDSSMQARQPMINHFGYR